MTGPIRLALYATGVILAAVGGGCIPLLSRHSSRRLGLFLAASAGVMLGVVGAHMLPDAFRAGPRAAWAVVGGFVFMLVVERFVLPHALHAPQVAEEHEHCEPHVEAQHAQADAAGIGAFIGLALHTMTDGLALAAAIEDASVAPYIFFAIVAHKIPSAFALGSIMTRSRASPLRVVLASAALGAMVGFGGTLFLVARSLAQLDATVLTPYAVGFSAGSFLHVAVTDLLPDLHKHGAEKRHLLASFIGGLLLTILLTLVFKD